MIFIITSEDSFEYEDKAKHIPNPYTCCLQIEGGWKEIEGYKNIDIQRQPFAFKISKDAETQWLDPKQIRP